MKCCTSLNWFWIRSNRTRRMVPPSKSGFIGRHPLAKVDALLPSLHIGVFNQRPLDTVSSSVIIVIMIILWVIKHFIPFEIVFIQLPIINKVK